MVKSLLLLTFLCLAQLAFSQNQRKVTDSLIQALKTTKIDTTKIHLLNGISWSLSQVGDFDKAKNYATDALALAEKVNFKKGMAKAYSNFGIIYMGKGNYAEALKNDFNALKINEEINDKNGMSSSYNNIGNVYIAKSNYDEALKNYLASLQYALEIKDKRKIASEYNNIGLVYSNQNDHDYAKALENYSKSLKAASEIGAKQIVSLCYGNIANIYRRQENYPQALKNYAEALKIEKEIGDKSGIAISYINLGQLSILLHKQDEAREYFNNGLTISKETGSKDQLKNCYLQLSLLDSASGNLSEAYSYLWLYSKIKDSLINENANRQISELMVQHETEKKDKEIAILNGENKIKTAQLEKQRIIKNMGFSLALLILLITILVFNNIRIKNRSKQLIKTNEIRQRISRDLHDEIGSGLSRLSLISQVTMQSQYNKEKLSENLLKMKTIAQQLNHEMNEMIWKVNPTYDTLESTLGYMRQYAGELLEENNIEYEINFPKQIKDIKVNTGFRRNIYSITKEALNNTVKHAGASKMSLIFYLDTEGLFNYTISDNGNGFDLNETGLFRNGLKNIRQRADEIGIRFKLESALEKGTSIVLQGNIRTTT